jgi:hypothetical protein
LRGAAPLLIGAAFLVLAACAPIKDGPFPDADSPDVSAEIDRDAIPGAFSVCHGYGCQWRTNLALRADEWRAFLDLFAQPAATAAEERARVAEAVAMMERDVGARIGTDADRPGTPIVFNDPTQLDCVDEAIDTSTTLFLLYHGGLLHWHVPAEPVHRGMALTLNIHYTAVLVEKGTKAEWAVDSWFYANGVLPAVLPLKVWRAGWHPGDPIDVRTAAR